MTPARDLSAIIGPAPSELDLGTFITMRLKPERERVSASLEAFRLGAIPSWSKAKAKPKKEKKPAKSVKLSGKKILAMLELEGLSLEDLVAASEKILRLEKEKKDEPQTGEPTA